MTTGTDGMAANPTESTSIAIDGLSDDEEGVIGPLCGFLSSLVATEARRCGPVGVGGGRIKLVTGFHLTPVMGSSFLSGSTIFAVVPVSTDAQAHVTN